MDFSDILEKLLSRIVLGAASEKKIEEEKTHSDPCGFRFSLFTGQVFINC